MMNKEANMYSVELFKKDGRVKGGWKLVSKYDTQYDNPTYVENDLLSTYSVTKYRWTIHQTYVTRTNLMSGLEFQERYDTPYYCSPSSETYWCS